jgi:hypothetical protein
MIVQELSIQQTNRYCIITKKKINTRWPRSHKFPGKQKHIPHCSIYITHGVITMYCIGGGNMHSSSMSIQIYRSYPHLHEVDLYQRERLQAHFLLCYDLKNSSAKCHNWDFHQIQENVPLLIYRHFFQQKSLRGRQFFFFEVKLRIIHFTKQYSSMNKEVAKT